ncbi:putative nucleic acid-binding Zn-ribbon protein [Bradyrhizobium sp. USDA 3262]
MALARSRRSESGFNYWPGFVDALSTLVLSIVFLLSVFLVVQFFLSQEVTGKDKALEQLTAKIAQLNDLLSLEKLSKLTLDDQVAQLRAGLASAEGERDRMKGLYEGLASSGSDAQGRANELNKALESEKAVSSRALAQIELLNQQISALRRQLAALEEALDASEKRDKESQNRIADLGQRLNVALAQRVQELSKYRSEFFGRLRAILGNRPDIRVVGDRFVFQSEVFFDTRPGDAAARGQDRARNGRERADRSRQADPTRDRLGAARRRPHRRAADQQSAVQVELGIVLGARDLGGAVPGLARRAGAASGRRRLRRIPTARHRTDRRRLQAQPPHRAEADGTLGRRRPANQPSLPRSTVFACTRHYPFVVLANARTHNHRI